MLASWLGVVALAVAVVFASPTAANAEPLFGGLFGRDGGAAATLNKPDTPPTQELRVRMLCSLITARGCWRWEHTFAVHRRNAVAHLAHGAAGCSLGDLLRLPGRHPDSL